MDPIVHLNKWLELGSWHGIYLWRTYVIAQREKNVMQYISIAYAKKCIINIHEPEKNPSITKWKLLSDSLQPHGLYSPWNSTGQNTGVGSLSILQGTFPTQGSNPGLPHCWQILYQLSHKGSPGILEWVAYPFSSRSSRPMNQTGVSCIAGGFFTNWTMREALHHKS